MCARDVLFVCRLNLFFRLRFSSPIHLITPTYHDRHELSLILSSFYPARRYTSSRTKMDVAAVLEKGNVDIETCTQQVLDAAEAKRRIVEATIVVRANSAVELFALLNEQVKKSVAERRERTVGVGAR